MMLITEGFLKFCCICWVNISYFRHLLAVFFVLYVIQRLSNINFSGSEGVPKLIHALLMSLFPLNSLSFLLMID